MTIVISCVVYFAGIIIVNILYFEKIKILKDRLKTSENHIDWLDHSNKLLHLKLKMYKERYYTNNPEFTDDIKDAVKYAMKYAHPDNGGSSEDFQKFRKLYESMK